MVCLRSGCALGMHWRDRGVDTCLGAEVDMGEDTPIAADTQSGLSCPNVELRCCGGLLELPSPGGTWLDLDAPSSTRRRGLDARGKGANLEGFLWLRGSRSDKLRATRRVLGSGMGAWRTQSRSAGGGRGHSLRSGSAQAGRGFGALGMPTLLSSPARCLSSCGLCVSSQRDSHTRLS